MIRKANPDDIQPLVELFRSYHNEVNLFKAAWNTTAMVENLRRYIILEKGDLAVALRGGKVVGATISDFITPIYSDEVFLECSIVYVLPEHRKGTLGVSLIKRLAKVAKDSEAKYVYLGITSGINSERTQRLYAKLGYKHIGSEFIKEVEDNG